MAPFVNGYFKNNRGYLAKTCQLSVQDIRYQVNFWHSWSMVLRPNVSQCSSIGSSHAHAREWVRANGYSHTVIRRRRLNNGNSNGFATQWSTCQDMDPYCSTDAERVEGSPRGFFVRVPNPEEECKKEAVELEFTYHTWEINLWRELAHSSHVSSAVHHQTSIWRIKKDAVSSNCEQAFEKCRMFAGIYTLVHVGRRLGGLATTGSLISH